MFTEILSWTGVVVAVGITIIYFGSLVRVYLYEKKIDELEDQKQGEINLTRINAGISLSFVEGHIKSIETEYDPKIKRLERKRRFILEKLPFIKK